MGGKLASMILFASLFELYIIDDICVLSVSFSPLTGVVYGD